MPKSRKSKPMAETLRTLIANSGKSTTAIAREAGIAQPVLHRFVTGERTLTLETADKLLTFFRLELVERRED
jgi:plasmid maintenance system antidote protein VapI